MSRVPLVGMLLVSVLTLCMLGCPPPDRGVRYSVTDLGSFGGDRSNAIALNEKGQVTGLSEMPNGIAQAFLWDPATGIRSIGSLNHYSEAWDINEHGQIVGETFTLEGAVRPFLWTPDVANGTTGTMIDLGTLGGFEGGAWQINAGGQVTGWSNIEDGSTHPFLWSPLAPNGETGAMVDLGTLGGQHAETRAINDLGQTVGRSHTTTPGAVAGFLWTPDAPNGDTGVFHDLGTLGGSFCEARSINGAGHVVGRSSVWEGGPHRAFRWVPSSPGAVDGVLESLGTLGGDSSIAYGVGSGGEVVGKAKTADGTESAFLWTEEEGMIDLNDRLPAGCRYNARTGKGWHITVARDVNAQGWIVGSGSLDHGIPRAVLLRPIRRTEAP